MTEDEAIAELERRLDPRSMAVLRRYVALLIAENEHQNLIAASTIDTIWSRHILDSAQLLDHAPASGAWVDVGSGGGLPGVVIAIARPGQTVLLEPRRRRADFLTQVSKGLGLTNLDVHQVKAADYKGDIATVISARAVAPIAQLLAESRNFTDLRTHFVLPRGRSAQSELAIPHPHWQGKFHVKPSITSSDAGIVIATGVKPR